MLQQFLHCTPCLYALYTMTMNAAALWQTLLSRLALLQLKRQLYRWSTAQSNKRAGYSCLDKCDNKKRS